MNKQMLIKIAGIAASIGGIAATLLSEWVKDRELDDKIADKVSEALESRESE